MEKSSTIPFEFTSNGLVPFGLLVTNEQHCLISFYVVSCKTQFFAKCECMYMYNIEQHMQKRLYTHFNSPEDVCPWSLGRIDIVSGTWIVPVETLVHVHCNLTDLVGDALDSPLMIHQTKLEQPAMSAMRTSHSTWPMWSLLAYSHQQHSASQCPCNNQSVLLLTDIASKIMLISE